MLVKDGVDIYTGSIRSTTWEMLSSKMNVFLFTT